MENGEQGVIEEVPAAKQSEEIPPQNGGENPATKNPVVVAKEIIGESKKSLSKLEKTLKDMSADEVLQYQRDLSVELGQNLFKGKIGEVFKKYKSTSSQNTKVKEVANSLKSEFKRKESDSTSKEISSLKSEALRAKVQVELLKAGVPQTMLEEASIVAMSKINDIKEIDKIKEVSAKFTSINTPNNPPAKRTSFQMGGKATDLTDGERAIAYLRQKNPRGFK